MLPSQVHPTILEQLSASSDLFSNEPAIYSEGGQVLSHTEVYDLVMRLGARLRAIGISRGDRVAICMSNGFGMSKAVLAVSAFADAVPMNPDYTEAEMMDYFRTVGASCVIVESGFSDLSSVRAANRLGIPDYRFRELEQSSKRLNIHTDLDPSGPTDTALTLLTSGSTGLPKIVPLSHLNICRSVYEINQSLDLSASDLCLCMWQQFHIGGLVDLLLAPLYRGGAVMVCQRFDAGQFFSLMDQWKPTWFQAVPAVFKDILIEAKRRNITKPFPSLRLLRSVAAKLDTEARRKLEEVFGVVVVQTYGMTEASPLVTSTSLCGSDPVDSLGKSMGTEIAVFADLERATSPRVTGAIAIRGENVFKGYENDPEANRVSFVDDWFLTGDLGWLDEEGRLYLTGRSKDLVNRGGEKINSHEVEIALLRLEEIEEAAVFPILHPSLGEDIATAIVLKKGTEFDETEAKETLKRSLSPFKIPSLIKVVDSMPLNAVGKVDKINLREITEKEREERKKSTGALKNDAEQRISKIWAGELGSSEVPSDVPLVHLGGDSLSALRIFLAIEEEFGLRLPNNLVSEDVTVERIGALIETCREDAAPIPKLERDGPQFISDYQLRGIEAVVGMTGIPRSDKSNVVCVTNSSGSKTPLVWLTNSPNPELLRFSDHLNKEQPLYGLYSGGKLFGYGDEASQPPLADFYAQELRSVFPDGGFVLGGNCRGARLAIEIATRLMNTKSQPLAICSMEFASHKLEELGLPTLLLCAKWSGHKAYRFLGWQENAWREHFPDRPQVVWIEGSHAGIFRDDTISSLASSLEVFLAGGEVPGSIRSFPGKVILLIHRVPFGFKIARRIYNWTSQKKLGPILTNPISSKPKNR
ncbi:MAG: AMP-binding protein [Verrucomicrobiae bacterium]|nr:AMP-binding protein [Verrucomicrobiae bacterium]NNJ43852.1 AMP-binding protein [Akkermansiaceae bacterium]